MTIPPYDRPSGYRAPPHPLAVQKRGSGKFLVLLAIVALLVAGWSGLWFYAASVAEEAIAGWKAREAKAGRQHTCTDQEIGGFPFRIELICGLAETELRNFAPPLQIKTSQIHVAAQIYQPTLLIAEAAGPLTFGETGKPPSLMMNWALAQSSIRGTPSAPERVSIVFEKPVLNRLASDVAAPVVQAKSMELHGRIAEGSAAGNPVIESVLWLSGASSTAHDVLATPLDADVTALLRGLKDFAPKPWAARFREIQAADGSIEIRQARVEQSETLAIGSGTLKLNAAGRLEGQIRLTVAGLDAFLKKLGIENSPQVDRLAGTLDRLMPGLGAIARSQAGAGVVAGVSLIGEPTVLEGRKAVSVPLRFTDGAMFLGPIPLGQSPALF